MDIRDIEEIVLALSKNEKALEALDPNSREKVRKLASEKEKLLKSEAEERKNREVISAKRRAELEERKRNLLCYDLGEWVRNIPKERRFVLVQRIGKEYRGHALDPWKDKNGWVDKVQFCAIDLVGGYMSPYWDYYVHCNTWGAFFRERLKPILDTKTDDDLAKRIEGNWNFFHHNDHNKGIPFAIVDYTIVGDDRNDIIINGHGPEKTLEEHFEDLRREFGGE